MSSLSRLKRGTDYMISKLSNILVKQREDKRKFLVIIWTLLIMSASFYLIRSGHFYYESNDDFYLSMITSGFFGKYYPYTIHNNILIGFFISLLSRISVACNWTTIFYLFCIITSYLCIGIYLINSKEAVVGFLLSCIFFGITYKTLLERMNYSKSAVIIIMSGLLLFTYYLHIREDNFKYRRIKLIFSAIWLILGCLIRYKTTIAVIPFFLLVALYYMDKSSVSAAVRSLKPYALIVLAVIVLWGIDYSVYHIDSEWRTYKEFNDIREQVMDYGIPEYQEYAGQYNEIGLSETDVALFRSWTFADRQVFNSDVLNKILKMKEPRALSLAEIKTVLFEIIQLYKDYFIVLPILLLFAIELLITKGHFFYPTAAMGILGIELAYLIWAGRFPERAVMVCFISTVGMLLLFFEKEPQLGDTTNLKLILAIMIVACLADYKSYCHPYAKEVIAQNHDETVQFLDYISKQEDKLFVWTIDTSITKLQKSYDMLDGFEYGLHKNSVLAGGWPAQSPFMAEKAEAFGNPYNILELLASNSNVFLVSEEELSKEDTLLLYIRQHYNPSAVYNLVEHVNGMYIYSCCP